MTRPCVNLKEDFQGVSFYQDLLGDAYSYGPTKGSWKHTRQEFSGRAIVWNASLDMQPNAALLEAFQHAHGGARLGPLSARDIQSNVAVTGSFPPPHKSSLQVVDTRPFPTLLFSATLDLKDSGAPTLDQRIAHAMSTGQLISGTIAVEFDAVDLKLRGELSLPRKEIARAVRSATSGEWIASVALAQHIERALRAVWSGVLQVNAGALSSADEIALMANCVERLSRDLVSQERTQTVLDQSLPYKQLRLREPDEMVDSEPAMVTATSAVVSRLAVTW